jgi:hypothetical protein
LSKSFDSSVVLNVKPCSFDMVGKKNGANFGTLGGSFGLFLFYFIKNIKLKIKTFKQHK